MNLNQSTCCCLCGSEKPSYNNPEPLRDSAQNCCNSCNRLVISARKKISQLPLEEREAYLLRLRSMTYAKLVETFTVEN